MNVTLVQYFQSEPLASAVGFVLLLLLFVLVNLPLVGGILYIVFFLLTLPMRRNERARLFLDLLELGLKDGRAPEAAIRDAATSRDPALSARFHRLAARLESGMRLSDGLELEPRLLPPQVRLMLKTGERIGDVAKVLPACRQLLRDGISQVRGALNYLILLAFCVTPFSLLVPLILMVKVVPAFKEIFAGMYEGAGLPAFTRFVLAGNQVLIDCQLAFLGLLWLAMAAYVGGPRLRGWVRRLLPGMPDWIDCLFPWRKKRLQRDFSAILAVLLDAAVPEGESVALAAGSTGNAIIVRRARQCCALLSQGVQLPEALRVLDDTGELQWRLANALHRHGGFLRALAGWHEGLEARAFQLEQAAAQLATAALVLFNGAIVAAIVIAMFLPLIQLIHGAVLW